MGNKIFDKDIVVLTIFDNNGCEYQIIVEIEFYELGMCFTNGYEHFFSAMLTSPVDTEKYVEIIGNSFDNPELLESGDFDE